MTKYQLTTLWTTLCYTLLWSAVSANTEEFESLECSPKDMEATHGDEVILHCYTKPPVNATGMTVEWMYNDDDVHVWRGGKNNLRAQKVEFKGKTSLFLEELSKGNCSLKLSVFIPGKYSCRVNKKHICSIIVTENPDRGSSREKLNIGTTPSPRPQNPDRGSSRDAGGIAGGIGGVFIGLLCLGGGGLVTWWWCCKKKPPVQEGGDRQDEGPQSQQAVAALLANNDGQNAAT